MSLEPARDSAGVPADTSSLRTLTIHLESEGDRGGSPLEPIVVPLARDAQSQLDPIEIDGVESMRIDVWGCVDTEDCARALLQFRGCTPTPIPLAAGSEVGVRIFMYPASDPRLQVCPPLP